MSTSAGPPPYPPNGGGTGGHGDSRPSSRSGSQPSDKMFEHIVDLQKKSQTGFKRDGSIQQALEEATRALNQADFMLRNFRRPDMSYVEYLRAYEIVVNVIPHLRGWADLQMDHAGGSWQKYQVLMSRINGLTEKYTDVKEIILSNNARSGVQPKQNGGNTGHARTESAPSANGNDLSGPMAGVKIKPTPSPKPESMHGRAISTSGAAAGPPTPLRDRFAALRNGATPVDTNRPGSRASTNSSIHGSPVSLSMPNSNDFGGRNSFESVAPSKPQGPRPLPAPPIPGKLPLDTTFAAAMPQEPKATYSPARNMQLEGNVQPPRHTARSLASTSTRKMSATSSASSHAPNGPTSDGGDYFPSQSQTNGAPPNQLPRRKSVHVPKETRISAERLYDYLERFNILLIDFRPRSDFDQGHIFTRNIICIDPIHMSYGMSADQLQDRMVISPDIEQEMFMHRDEYDLVIYYDTDTQSDTFLSRPVGDNQTKLKYLHEALLDYNHDKPLQWPPILLIGGIDAWIGLVGNQTLMTSDTANRSRPGRPIQRRPAGGAGPLRPPKRRFQEYNPLDAEETQQWKERARAESVVLQPPTQLLDGDGHVIEEEPEEEEKLDSAAIDEFNERFPEAGNLDRFAFSSQQPTRPPPELPPKVPMYPTRPPSSAVPAAPARPTPAAPRVSYTGVSDRAASQNAPVVRSSSLVPYVPMKYLNANMRLPRTGLYNFRFTCYMNATLQAMSGTVPLSLHFIEEAFWKSVQYQNNKGGSKGVMPEIYMNLIKSLWKGDVSWIKPTTFRKFCGRLNSAWGTDNEEQDAEEFCIFLLDTLHEDLNVNCRSTILPALTEAEEATREKMPPSVAAKLEWWRYTHREQSYIQSLFGHQHYNQLRFPECGHTSTTYTGSFSINLPIPNLRAPTLDDCMKHYFKIERLNSDEAARCSICKVSRRTDKQILISRAPQFLVIVFKRFQSFDSRSSRKVTTAVDFPLQNFDLGPYMLPQPSQEEAAYIAKKHGPELARPDPAMTGPFKYDAYAVVRHIGNTIGSGHYMSLVKDPARGVWRCFNDQQHKDFVPGEGQFSGPNGVQNGQAYIVFYQRVMPQQQGGPIGPGGVGKI